MKEICEAETSVEHREAVDALVVSLEETSEEENDSDDLDKREYHSELIRFWTLSIVQYSKNSKN
jgi:hypothetical protein